MSLSFNTFGIVMYDVYLVNVAFEFWHLSRICHCLYGLLGISSCEHIAFVAVVYAPIGNVNDICYCGSYYGSY